MVLSKRALWTEGLYNSWFKRTRWGAGESWSPGLTSIVVLVFGKIYRDPKS